jgi:hypothetical protein
LGIGRTKRELGIRGLALTHKSREAQKKEKISRKGANDAKKGKKYKAKTKEYA